VVLPLAKQAVSATKPAAKPTAPAKK